MNNYDVVYSPLSVADMDTAWDEIYAVCSDFETEDYISKILGFV